MIRDTDGVVDQCEYELADVFAPRLQFDSRDCNTGREPYWAAKYEVSPIDGEPVIKIFYAISYYKDCGSPNPSCVIPACGDHEGDSEFIIVEGKSNGSTWVLKRATLSAHFNVDAGGPVDTYDGHDMEYTGSVYLGRPFIWVALDKHANYRSQSVCDAGQWYYDTCDRPGSRPIIEVLSSANLGRDQDLIIDEVGSRAGRPGIERYWGPNSYFFLGWYDRYAARSSDTTAYGRLLRFFGFD